MCTLFFLAAMTTPQLSSSPTQQALRAQVIQQEAAAGATQKEGASRSLMMINPKERAGDYEKAFQMLRQEKSSGKVFFTLNSGEKVSNVVDMKLMPNNTVVVFRLTTTQGTKLRVVDIEDIIGIEHAQ